MNTHYGTAKLPILIVEWSLCFVCLFVTIPISGRIQPNENQNHRTTQIPTSTGKRTVRLFSFILACIKAYIAFSTGGGMMIME